MKEVNLTDIYRLLKESVKYFSRSNSVPTPNTFAVIESEKVFDSDIQNEQLGYTILAKDKPHLFSRNWEAAGYNPSAFTWSYPGVFVFEQNMIQNNIFDQRKGRYWNITINVLIKDFNSIKDDNFAAAAQYKTRSELYNDAEDILMNLFEYINNCVIASTSLDSTLRVYNSDYLIYINANSGVTYTINEIKSRVFLSEFVKENDSPKIFNRWFIESLQSVCVFTEIRVYSNCQELGSFDIYGDEPLTYDRQPDPYLDNLLITTDEAGVRSEYEIVYKDDDYSPLRISGIELIICDSTTMPFTINLPSAVGNKALFIIKKDKNDGNTNNVYIQAQGLELIDSINMDMISLPNASMVITSDDTKWVKY